MMMIQNQQFDKERALYGLKDVCVQHCIFDGPADGESALKECENVRVEESFFDLRYSLWSSQKTAALRSGMTRRSP